MSWEKLLCWGHAGSPLWTECCPRGHASSSTASGLSGSSGAGPVTVSGYTLEGVPSGASPSYSMRYLSSLSCLVGGGGRGRRRVSREVVGRCYLGDVPLRCRVALNVMGLSVTWSHWYSGVLVAGRVLAGEYLEVMTNREVITVASSFFKKPPSVKVDGKGGTDPEDAVFAKKYPTLWDYLSKACWPDGEVRKRSSLIVFGEDGMVKACLSDRECEASLWAASASFVGVLEALEGRLSEDKPDWRPAKKKK